MLTVYKFHMDIEPLIAKMESNSLPPLERVLKHEWTYTPCPLSDMPMPSHIFMHYLTTSGQRHRHSIWGPRMPQKVGDQIRYHFLAPGTDIWGIHILEGPYWALIISVMIIFAMLGVVVAAIYSVYTKYLQTGLAINGYAAALQGMAFTLFIVKGS